MTSDGLAAAPGPIRRFLDEDHRRLDALVGRLVDGDGVVDRAVDDALRRGLLRHLAWEESILMRLAQALREGEPLPFMTRVRLEHRAIRALLVPTPSAAVATTLARVLAAHARTEAATGGLYDLCDTLVSSDAGAVVERLRRTAEVDPPPHDDGHECLAAARRALAQADLAADDL